MNNYSIMYPLVFIISLTGLFVHISQYLRELVDLIKYCFKSPSSFEIFMEYYYYYVVSGIRYKIVSY